MPFTPSHMAAALPFLRTPLLPAAVVVGTMAPDISYYVPLFVARDLSHSLLGLVTVDLLLGVLGALAWWVVLRAPILDALPRRIGTRIAVLGRLGWRPSGWGWPVTILVLVISALVGGTTHLVWDSFTHPGWLVDHVAFLRLQLGPLPLDKWLQHLSSVGGLVVVAVWATRWLGRAVPDPTRPTRLTGANRRGAWIVVLAAGILGGLLTWIHGLLGGTAPFDPNLVFLVARFGIGIGGAAVLAVVVFWYLARRGQPRTS
jgi:hypothetical protein